MPFGLANAPACFQRFIQFVLWEVLNISCFVYIDDILLFSKMQKEHQQNVTLWELLLGWIGSSLRGEITEDNIPDTYELLQLLRVV
jgi:hypothetical protein